MSGGVGNGGGAVKILEDFLKSIRGCPVMVKLNSGIDYKGYSLLLFLGFFFLYFSL